MIPNWDRKHQWKFSGTTESLDRYLAKRHYIFSCIITKNLERMIWLA